MLDHAGPRWTMLDHAGPRWTMLDQGKPRWTMLDHAGPCWTMPEPRWTTLDHTGPRWTMLDQGKPRWTTLDHAGPWSSILSHAKSVPVYLHTFDLSSDDISLFLHYSSLFPTLCVVFPHIVCDPLFIGAGLTHFLFPLLQDI